jgi:hypothetical protein
MRISLTFVLPILLLAASAAPAGATLTCYPQIPVTMVTTVTSQSGYSGQVFRFRVTTATTSNGTLFPANAVGYGVVLSAVPASNRARNGFVVLEPRFVIVGGQQVQVAGNPHDASVLMHGVDPLSDAAGVIPVPGVGLAAKEAIKGTNITIGPGYNFHVVPIGNLQQAAPCVQS